MQQRVYLPTLRYPMKNFGINRPLLEFQFASLGDISCLLQVCFLLLSFKIMHYSGHPVVFGIDLPYFSQRLEGFLFQTCFDIEPGQKKSDIQLPWVQPDNLKECPLFLNGPKRFRIGCPRKLDAERVSPVLI